MIYMRWTGLGWLAPVLFILACLGGGTLVGTLTPDGFPVLGSVAIAMLLGAVVHRAVGRALNSTDTPQGRVWHDTHTYFGAPMQRLVGLYLLVALVAGAIAVAQRSSPVVGWAMVLGTPVVGLVAFQRLRTNRRVRGLADRKQLAHRRGWRYKDADMLLATRWKDVYGRRVVNELHPFGIVAGELSGLPFTAFDTEVSTGGARQRRTTWAVHLPVAYPGAVVTGADAEPPPGSGEAHRTSEGDVWNTFFDGARTAEAAEFRRALLTPEVRRATATLGLSGWEIAGRDLVWRSADTDTSRSADEIVRVAGQLVELARLFPAGLAERYGIQPTTGIPLADPLPRNA